MQNNHASGTQRYYNSKSLYIKRGKVSVRNVWTFVHNAGRGQLSSEWRHNENHVIMRTTS